MIAKNKTVRLVSGFTIDDVAEACRSAAIDFLDGVRDGWGQRELAAWLVGPYHQLSILRCSADERAAVLTTPLPDSGVLRSATPKRVAEQDVDKAMRSARKEVLRVIERFSANDPAAETFVWRVRNRGGLARVEDENGVFGLVPNEGPTQRLVERVLSLIAADYVARPLDYEDRVAICTTCKTISFDEVARAAGDCGAHRGSGMRPRVDFNDIISDSDLDVEKCARLRDHFMSDLADNEKTG
ncbi:MAG: hypothetical protein ABI461_16170 [Polyangiaceae bacterium]